MAKHGLRAACEDERLLNLRPFPKQGDLLDLIERHRFVIAAAGRRFSKTTAAAAGAIWNLLLTPEADALVRPGERRYAMCVATSREQANVFLNAAETLLHNSPELRRLIVSRTENEIELAGKRIIAAMPCSSRALRGYAASFVCFDEMAHMNTEVEGPAAQDRVWAALTPSVLQFKEHGRVVAISSPEGENLFSKLFEQARSGELPESAAFHATSLENPMVAADEAWLESQRIALGEDGYRREILAEFIGGGSSYFDDTAVRACVIEPRSFVHGDGQGWVAAFDPGFESVSALAIVGRDGADHGRLVTAHVERWVKPKRKLKRRTRTTDELWIAQTMAAVAHAVAPFRITSIYSDQHYPRLVADELSKHGLGCTVAAWDRERVNRAFNALRVRIELEKIELPNDPQLLRELGRVRTKVRAGSSGVDLPVTSDGHCDLVVALALAVSRFEGGGSQSPEFWAHYDSLIAKRDWSPGLPDIF
jgi:phage terminase large subunit-like protein